MAQNKDFDWTVFLGCMFIGLGLGVLLDHAAGGLLIGMGVGLLVTALVPQIRK